jgi:hypothetical protein
VQAVVVPPAQASGAPAAGLLNKSNMPSNAPESFARVAIDAQLADAEWRRATARATPEDLMQDTRIAKHNLQGDRVDALCPDIDLGRRKLQLDTATGTSKTPLR